MDQKVLDFRDILTICKKKYEDYFIIKDKYDFYDTALQYMKDLLKRAEKVYSRKRIYLVLAIIAFLLTLCFVFLISNTKNISKKAQYDFYAYTSFMLFILFLIPYFIARSRFNKLNSIYLSKSKELIDLNEASIYKTDISYIRNLITAIKQYLDTKLYKELDQEKEVLSKKLMEMDPYVTTDYQTYDHICVFLKIINNGRIETMKELINTMVNDFYNEKLIESINDTAYSLRQGFNDLFSEISKNTEAIKANTAAVAAGSAAIAASRSINNGSVISHCQNCAKFSKCRNPYVYGCGAFVPR